jgi:hypothetical protein
MKLPSVNSILVRPELRLRAIWVALFALALSSSAAHAASPPVWTSARPISEPLLVARGTGLSDLAWDGEVYLVARKISERQLAAIRIDARGQLIDHIPFPIASASLTSIGQPRVVPVGGRFLVLWISGHQEVRGRFVDRHGKVSPEFHIASGFTSSLHAVTDGRDILVAGSMGVFLLRNTTTDSPTIHPVSMPEGSYFFNSMASDGNGFVIAAQTPAPERHTLLIRLASGATRAEVAERLPELWAPQLAPLRSGYLLFSGGRPLTAQPLRFDGTVEGEPLHITGDVDFVAWVTTVSDADGVTVVWHARSSAHYGAPVPLMMTRIEGRSVALPQAVGVDGHAARLAGPAAAPLLFWSDPESLRHGFLDLHNSRLQSNQPTTLAPADQFDADVVATPLGWFTVWSESRLPQQSQLRAAIIDPSLARGPAFDIDAATLATNPFAAASDRIVLVVWQRDYERLMARRFTPAGEPLDHEPFVIAASSDGAGPPVWNGRYFLVPFFDRANLLSVARVTEEGLVVGTTEVARVARESPEPPRIAVAGETALLVWQVGAMAFACPVTCIIPTTPQIDGVRLSVEGRLIDPLPVRLSPLSAIAPALAGAGESFLLAWRESSAVRYRIIRATDFEAGPIEVAAPGFAYSFTRLAAVARQDDFTLFWDEAPRLEAAFISHQGHLLGWMPAGSSSAEHRWGISAAARGNDLLLLDWAPRGLPINAWRVFYRGYLQPVPRRRGVTPPSPAGSRARETSPALLLPCQNKYRPSERFDACVD